MLDDETRDAAETIIGNLDEDGYLTATLDEMAHQGGSPAEVDGSGRSRPCSRSTRRAWARAI